MISYTQTMRTLDKLNCRQEWKETKGIFNDLSIKTLTGTEAMRVGFRTLASPLLPFLILVDCSEMNKMYYSRSSSEDLWSHNLERSQEKPPKMNLTRPLPDRPECEGTNNRYDSREKWKPALHWAPKHVPMVDSQCRCLSHWQHISLEIHY